MAARDYFSRDYGETRRKFRLHAHGDPESARGRGIKAMVRDAFYGDKDGWKAMIFEQAIAAERDALRGLAG